MTRQELISLIDQAAEAAHAYACAIDGHLYRQSSYYAQQEQAVRNLVCELEHAAQVLREGTLEG